MVSRDCSRLRAELKNSGLVRLIDNIKEEDIEKIPTVLDESYMEMAIYRLFFISVPNLIEIKAALAKNFHIQPSEIDKLPYWEYELFMKSLNEQVKEENEKQQSEMDKYDVQGTMKSARDMQRKPPSVQMPKMPNFGSMKMPNMKF